MKGWYGNRQAHSLASRGIRSSEMRLPKEYREYDANTLMKIWNIHYKMFNNISSWGGDATDHLDEMNEIVKELENKGYQVSGEFTQKGDMKFMKSSGINKNPFTFYSDAGHGWLSVRKEYLKDLGIEKDISEYSYVKGSYVLLEEDQDAMIFLSAYEKKYGVPQINEVVHEGESRIRNYDRYVARGEYLKFHELSPEAQEHASQYSTEEQKITEEFDRKGVMIY